jgi:WD repeat-containing protein 48
MSTHSREQQWIASGSFDRTIKLWDMNRTESTHHAPEPLMTLTPPDANAPKSSIYAITADPFGRAIASGSPERVIRMWDPRSGKRTAKLVGHTDNIRAILISDDSRYVSLMGFVLVICCLWVGFTSFLRGLRMVRLR